MKSWFDHLTPDERVLLDGQDVDWRSPTLIEVLLLRLAEARATVGSLERFVDDLVPLISMPDPPERTREEMTHPDIARDLALMDACGDDCDWSGPVTLKLGGFPTVTCPHCGTSRRFVPRT